MKTTIITCDLCKVEMPQRGWEDAPQRLVIMTHCSCQNPMGRFNGQHQANTYTAEDVCRSCMKSIARIIADGIESLDNKTPQPQ
jgi:hypothetical protein